MIHVGISVINMDESMVWYANLGYEPTFDVVRNEPFLGEIVGLPGAEARIVYMTCEGRPTIELLEYRNQSRPVWRESGATLPGRGHLCLDRRATDFIGPEYRIGAAVIPDGRNQGSICAYYQDPNGFVVEMMTDAKDRDLAAERG